MYGPCRRSGECARRQAGTGPCRGKATLRQNLRAGETPEHLVSVVRHRHTFVEDCSEVDGTLADVVAEGRVAVLRIGLVHQHDVLLVSQGPQNLVLTEPAGEVPLCQKNQEAGLPTDAILHAYLIRLFIHIQPDLFVLSVGTVPPRALQRDAVLL